MSTSIKVKGLLDEDFVNYRKCSMFILFPYCTFKCEHECGIKCCQNSTLAKDPIITIDPQKIVDRYINNPLTSAIVFGGLEPFDSWEDLKEVVEKFRAVTDDDIVIYSGYYENELDEKIRWLKQYPNIIIKFGRFIPNQLHHKDDLLGVELASPNQYAQKMS